MKIVVTSYGKTVSDKMDRSFGRAKYFVVSDTENGDIKVFSNEQNVNASQGAGIQAARNVTDLGADIVITGNVGPNAFRTLTAASVRIFVAGKECETVKDALLQWESGTLQEVTDATVEGHWV